MNQEQALNVLVQAVQIAQSKGAYSLQEAAIVASAVSLFIKKEDIKVEEQEVEEVKED